VPDETMPDERVPDETVAGEPVVVRDAVPDDVPAVRAFGEAHVPPHYAPLIGVAAAQEQVRRWWAPDYLASVVGAGEVVVASSGGTLVGVGQRGRWDGEDVIYKLYVDPAHRGRGLGPRLVDALVRQLPADAERLWVEHLAGNERAAAFYEREGFVVDRVEPSPAGDPARAQVWRVRSL
jgi:ribosomal protein S18 acetylase RimI-like enzyme